MTTTASRILTIDPAHSTVGFTVRHLMITKVRGAFSDVKGTVTLGDASPIPVSIDAEVAVASVSTRQPDRDAHLKSPDFFDAPTYPTMTFRSTSIEPTGDAGFSLVGDLTIHGQTKSVTFEGEFTGQNQSPAAPGGTRFAYEATTKIKRSEFGLTFNMPLETGGVAISDEVTVELDVQATS